MCLFRICSCPWDRPFVVVAGLGFAFATADLFPPTLSLPVSLFRDSIPPLDVPCHAPARRGLVCAFFFSMETRYCCIALFTLSHGGISVSTSTLHTRNFCAWSNPAHPRHHGTLHSPPLLFVCSVHVQPGTHRAHPLREGGSGEVQQLS